MGISTALDSASELSFSSMFFLLSISKMKTTLAKLGPCHSPVRLSAHSRPNFWNSPKHSWTILLPFNLQEKWIRGGGAGLTAGPIRSSHCFSSAGLTLCCLLVVMDEGSSPWDPLLPHCPVLTYLLGSPSASVSPGSRILSFGNCAPCPG